jgi:hypothetical protein
MTTKEEALAIVATKGNRTVMTKCNTVSAGAYRIADNVTNFVNKAFGRKLGLMGPSRSLQQAVQKALNNGYTEDEIRIAYWAARCVPGESWINKQLHADLQPEIILRHSGGMNKITGKPAVRWLDDLVEKAAEINKPLARATLEILPECMRMSEEALLGRVGIL